MDCCIDIGMGSDCSSCNWNYSDSGSRVLYSRVSMVQVGMSHWQVKKIMGVPGDIMRSRYEAGESQLWTYGSYLNYTYNTQIYINFIDGEVSHIQL